jgi:hypothetical protein
MTNDDKPPQDPPVVPMIDSDRWFETGPDSILTSPDAAVLIVRIGMAMNAVQAHLGAYVLVLQGKPSAAERYRASLTHLVNTAALAFEMTRLAQENMAVLRRLASVFPTDRTQKLLAEIGQLCAGKHPASDLLDRARNRLAFHWDKAEIAESVIAFGRNEKLVWLESSGEQPPVHRLALDVMARALLPGTDTPDPELAQVAIRQALEELQAADHLLLEFFTAATYGYMRESRARRRERLVGGGG